MIKDEIIDKFKHVPYELKVVCMGTTQAHFALDFSNSDIKGYNMACFLHPVKFNAWIIDKYSKHIDKNAIILIAVEYPIFCIDDYKRVAETNKQQYAKIVPFKNTYCSYFEQFIQYIMPIKRGRQSQFLDYLQDLEKRNRYRNHFKPWEIKEMCETLVSNGWENDIGVNDYVLKGHINNNAEMTQVMENVVFDTINFVELCKSYGWNPVILGLPYCKALCDYVPTSFKEKCFYNNIQKIVNETKCEFWDYSEDEIMTDIHNFMGIWYLNSGGREKFIRLIEQRVLHNK